MGVVNHLKKFLAEQPKQAAAVPGLGVFYVGEKDGSSCVLFKEVSPTDRTFLNYIAFEDNISEEDARAEMEKWVRQILQDLKASGNVYIDGVGSFSILSDRVEFVPEVAAAKPVKPEFGLEEDGMEVPAPERPLSAPSEQPAEPRVQEAPGNKASVSPVPNPAQPQPVQSRVQEKRPNPVRLDNHPNRNVRQPQNDRKPGKDTFRPGQNDNRQRPAGMRPALPNKELVLENRRGGNAGQGGGRGPARKSPQVGGKNIFTQWWFLLCCLVVVLLIVLLAVRPVRESVFGAGRTSEMESVLPDNGTGIEEQVDMMLASESSGDEAVLADADVASENEQIAEEVIAGQVQRERAGKEARSVQSEPKPKPRPTAEPAAEKAVQPVSQAFAPQAPVSGKYYIIVGSFVNKANARNTFNDLKKKGQSPVVLYVAAKEIYYISVKACSTRAEAVDAKAYFRDQKKVDCWIYEAK